VTKWRSTSIISIASLALSLLGFGGTPARGATLIVDLLPPVERSIFILDISGSTNSSQVWKNSLRPSLIKKLAQPFGFPTGKKLSQKSAPVDVTIRVINAQSIDAPSFPIVGFEDAAKMWGLIDKIGTSPTSKRLGLIVDDFFGGDGAFTQQARIFSNTKIVPPSRSVCQFSVVKSFQNSKFMNDLDQTSKLSSAQVICGLIIDISKRLQNVDAYFLNPNCVKIKNSCSDIVGAILNTTYAANDLYAQRAKSKLCVAIASDMLNNFPGMSDKSALNTRKIVLKSAMTAEMAKSLGRQAAEQSGVKFPAQLPVRIFVLGQGSGPDPIPLDKNSILTAYWNGFWEAAGISSSNQIRSLDQACS
jgi:hypothetical protein